jgi:hypothetical protein
MCASIPRLTPIGDGVTANLREQYEENPFPRWVRLADPPVPIMIDDHIRRHFPTAPFRPLGDREPLDILVAGCVLAVMRSNSHKAFAARACLASMASLASATRRIPPQLTGKIEFAQADIFALASINRRFDVINAGDVLHHMDDPLGGWRELI